MNWKEYRLLLSWLFWFGVVFIVTVVMYHQGHIDYLIATDTTGMTMGIFYGIVFGVLWNARNMFMIQRELTRAYQMENMFQKNEKTPTTLWYRKTYIGDHITELQRAYASKKNPNHENLIEILQTRLEIPEKYTQYLNYALPVTGFLGTLIGLSMVIGSLDIMAGGSVSPQKAAEIITQFTAGMKTAFNTTIAGFIGSLVLYLFQVLVKNGMARFITKLAELDELYVVPDLKSHVANNQGEGGALK